MIYLVISVVAVGLMMIQNVNVPKNKYCVGLYECHVSESYKVGFFLGKIIYLIFWTWVLNLMCDAGCKICLVLCNFTYCWNVCSNCCFNDNGGCSFEKINKVIYHFKKYANDIL